MLFVIESAVLCALFSVVIILVVGRNPIKGIMSFPKSIRKRVESLPQYSESIQTREQRHISLKIVGALLLVVVFFAVAWFSGQRKFFAAFFYVFGLFTVVNLWDLVVIDWGWACHSKRIRIPGTEDMDKEYRDPWHHLRGFFIGCAIGLAVSLLAGGAVVIGAALL